MVRGRVCPVCFKGTILRADQRTCCTECSREWMKMPRGEQVARMRRVDPDAIAEAIMPGAPRHPVEELTIDPEVKAAMERDAEQAVRFDRRLVDPSLFMPKGIIPEEDEPKLPLSPSDNRTNESEDNGETYNCPIHGTGQGRDCPRC